MRVWRTSAGRPLRFLALTLGGWTMARVVTLWPAAALPGSVVAVPSRLAATMADGLPPVRVAVPSGRAPIGTWPLPPIGRTDAEAQVASPPARVPRHHPTTTLALAAMIRYGGAVAIGPVVASQAAIPAPLGPMPPSSRSRLAGSAWLIARGNGSNGGTLLGGQLGASQAGARLTYALGEARRVAISARIATPLRGRGSEAAFGIDWQPTRMPLHLLAEQRVSLDGGRGGPALLAIGGIDPTPILAGFRVEGYGQAGAIKRGGVAAEAFGDGAARVTHVLASIGTARIDLGGGAWGAAQRGVRRLDVGPTIGAAVPVATTALRVTLDWRQRVAGNARPGSGPALSIGTDF